MNVSQQEFQNMKEEIVKNLISSVMTDFNVGLQEAFDYVYGSRLFEKLGDEATGLYFQSPKYVYSFLKEEILSESKNN